MTNLCANCQGLIMEPNKAYGWAGKTCYCNRPIAPSLPTIDRLTSDHERLKKAVRNLLDQKGRHNTEIAYKRLEQVFSELSEE